MKLFHLADLHFGKTVYGLSMLEDQKYWTEEFLKLCREERPDAVMIAGDVYDRASPSGDAVELLDHLLTSLSESGIPVMMAAGNHDSGQKLAFGSAMLSRQNVYIAGAVCRDIMRVRMEDPDGFGPLSFWLLPYLYPEAVSAALAAEEPVIENNEGTAENNEGTAEGIRTYDEAIRALLQRQPIDPAERNIILSHQNVTAGGREAERGGSESMVGGVGQIDFSAYDIFDYAALGHIHSAYPVGREAVRYAGTPLCYHFNETRQENKGVTEILLKEKGSTPQIRILPIQPLHRMRFLEGTRAEIYETLAEDAPGDAGEKYRGEYVGIRVTDERITPAMASYLRSLLKSRESLLLELTSASAFFAGAAEAGAAETQDRALEELFSDLYTEQSGGIPPTDEEYAVMKYAAELTRRRDTREPVPAEDLDRLLARAASAGAAAAGPETAGDGAERDGGEAE